eukprot:2785892-Prymnesium_polylepis.1
MCVLSAHAGVNAVRDRAICCVVQRSGHAPRASAGCFSGASSCRCLRCVVAPVHGTRRGARLAA